MIVMVEAESAALVTDALALDAARRAFTASVAAAELPAVVVPAGGGNTFSVKPGAAVDGAGVKIGSFWPGNERRGIPRHSSVVVLLDQATGRVAAVVETAAANAYRTAAADALAVQTLARPDASTLAVIGAGNQAHHEVRAVCAVHRIDTVLVAARSADAGRRLADRLNADGIADARTASVEQACRGADVLVTATSARAPLFDASWIAPGAHISCMGADAPGKQELPPELFARAELFCDLPGQSRRLGEFQHADPGLPLTPIGRVLDGSAPGRSADDAITAFDSSGFGLQDLYLALALIEAGNRA